MLSLQIFKAFFYKVCISAKLNPNLSSVHMQLLILNTLWLDSGSDSWGAKVHPVKEQEWAAEGAITILPKQKTVKGKPK